MIQKNPIYILEHMVFEGGYPSGIDSVINSMVATDSKFEWKIVGVTENPDVALGVFFDHPIYTHTQFMAVARVTKRDVPRIKVVPHSIKYAFGLIRFKSRLRPSTVHAHRVEIGFISKIIWPKINLIQFVHNSNSSLTSMRSDSHWKYFKWVYKIIETFLFRKATKFLVFNQNEYIRISRVFRETIRCFTWFDSHVFKFVENSAATNSRIRIAWIGRLESQKNPLLLIAIAEELRKRSFDFIVNIYGSGSLRTELDVKIKAEGLSEYFSFQGMLHPNELSQGLAQSDVLLMTSIYEGSPTIVVESMGCGVPVLCTQGSDPDELVINGFSGYKVIGDSPSSFPDFLLEIGGLSRKEISDYVSYRSKDLILPMLLNDCEI